MCVCVCIVSSLNPKTPTPGGWRHLWTLNFLIIYYRELSASAHPMMMPSLNDAFLVVLTAWYIQMYPPSSLTIEPVRDRDLNSFEHLLYWHCCTPLLDLLPVSCKARYNMLNPLRATKCFDDLLPLSSWCMNTAMTSNSPVLPLSIIPTLINNRRVGMMHECIMTTQGIAY